MDFLATKLDKNGILNKTKLELIVNLKRIKCSTKLSSRNLDRYILTDYQTRKNGILNKNNFYQFTHFPKYYNTLTAILDAILN